MSARFGSSNDGYDELPPPAPAAKAPAGKAPAAAKKAVKKTPAAEGDKKKKRKIRKET